MAQDLTTSSPVNLPAVDTQDPATMLLLPEWLNSQLSAVSDLGAERIVVDPTTRQITARIATIPKSKMPSGAQRSAIRRRITELQGASEAGPADELIVILGDLIQEHAPSRLDARTVEIKAGAYLDAVDDLPAWTVREAIRRWRRGEVDASPETLDFAPKPPRLAAIAKGIALVAKGQAIRLQRVLDAEPDGELSDAERGANLKRLAALSFEPQPVRDSKYTDAGSDASERRRVAADLKRREEIRKREEESAA